jgi:glycogen synthase
MHVALVTHEYPPYIFGGIGTFTKNLASGLSKSGIDVTIISGYPVSQIHSKNIYQETDNGITILRYPYPNFPPRHTIFQLANLKSLTKCIKNLNVDLIHGQSGSIFPLLPNIKNIAPVIVTFHSSPKAERLISCCSISRGGSFRDLWTYVVSYPVWNYTFREELSNSNLAVAVSKTLKMDLLDEMGQTYQDKIQEIHNGIDIELLDKEYGNVDSDIPESEKTILFAGRMYWRKGALNIIQLAYWLQKLKVDYKIVAHGEGPLVGAIKNSIHSLNLTNIELKGFTSKKQLMSSMKRSAFVIVPSFYEACPMTMLESMCLGKVPVMFDLPFAREFTENGKYGILAANTKEMALKIKQIDCGEIDLKKLSKSVLSFSRKRYDITRIANAYCSAYQKIV